MGVIRRVTGLCLLSTALVGCGLVHSGGANGAGSIVYTAEFGDDNIKAEATIVYTDASGNDITTQAPLPWKSDPVTVHGGKKYHLTVTAPTPKKAYLSCGVETDTGFIMGPTVPSQNCAFTYPDR